MRYYPINLDIKNRKCLVVGGGGVGTRKVITLVECGADVTVVSYTFSKKLLELADSNSITFKKRAYQTSDLNGMFLVIGATDNENLNNKISIDAKHFNMLCNIADRPKVCNFILPAIVTRGDLLISISTSGKSPAFAKKMRKKLENEFGEEYAQFLQLMGAIRKKLLGQAHEPEAHKNLFEKTINEKLKNKGVIEMIRENNKKDINILLFKIFGQGFEYDILMKTN